MLRDIIIFFAGVETFHTLSHIMLPYFIELPFESTIMITPAMNFWAIGINAAITIGLLLWAKRLSK